MKRKSVLLVDLANINSIVSYAVLKDFEVYSSKNWTKECSKATLQFLSRHIQTIKPDKVVIAQEAHCWRKDYYPDYKENRKDLERPKYIKESQDICESFFDNYTDLVTIKVNGAEGDDVIAICTLELKDTHDVVILSNDKDFHQLLKYPSVSIFHPREKVYKSNYDEFSIFMKYFRGDRKDNVPNIWKGLRETKIRDFYENKDSFNLYLEKNKQFRELWNRNVNLMKLSSKVIPEDIVEGIAHLLEIDHSAKKPEMQLKMLKEGNFALRNCMKIFKL